MKVVLLLFVFIVPVLGFSQVQSGTAELTPQEKDSALAAFETKYYAWACKKNSFISISSARTSKYGNRDLYITVDEPLSEFSFTNWVDKKRSIFNEVAGNLVSTYSTIYREQVHIQIYVLNKNKRGSRIYDY